MKKSAYLVLFGVTLFCSVSRAQTTFDYTGAVQTYTVPSCVGSLLVDVKGAEGAGAPPGAPVNIGGKGGRVQATIYVTPGEVLNIYVGEKPTSNIGGWNGGGSGGGSSNSGGGGGASDIRRGGNDLSSRVVVAGGGGGATHTCAAGNDGGGHGGKPEAEAGWDCDTHGGPNAGKGGTQTEGGAGGVCCSSGTPGDLGVGGNGGVNASIQEGGGGGAGYYGGGGGGYRGGGGGSSFTISTASGVVHAKGFQTGNGQIIITANPPGLVADAGIDTIICNGDSVTLNASGGGAYSWSPADGLSCTDCPNPVANPSVTTNYTVTVSIDGCTPDSDSVLVTVNDCGETGIRKISGSSILTIFPNPAEDVLYLQLSNTHGKLLAVSLLNILGQVVYNDNITGEQLQAIDISGFEKGIYHLRLTGEDVFIGEQLMIQ